EPEVMAWPSATSPNSPVNVAVPPTGNTFVSPFTDKVTGVNVLFRYVIAVFAFVWQKMPEYPVGQLHSPSEHCPPFSHTIPLHVALVHELTMTAPTDKIVMIVKSVNVFIFFILFIFFFF